MSRPLRIAQVAPPMETVPPKGYGGTERIIHELVAELTRRGHDVTTFASGDSTVPGRHVATVPVALRPMGFGGVLDLIIGLTACAAGQSNNFSYKPIHYEIAR